jgi:hypothetical protein
MKTRSQSKELEVNIDFDEASLMWNANKKKLKNGCYEYVCGKQLKNGEFCKNKRTYSMENCRIHKN